MLKLLKRLLAVGLIGSLVGVVVYATIKPEVLQELPGGLPGRKETGQGKGGKQGAGSLVPVLVAQVKRQDMPVLLEGVGTARALQTVTVRPQVDGRILKLAFTEGQDVKAGDLLAEIDAATYKAQLDQLIAKRALTQAQLDNARLDAARYQKIPGVIAQKTVDTQRAQVDQLAAQINADTAAIANAQAMLDYTRITAPIGGRTGIRLVDAGNLVRAGDAGIVVISQLKPISVIFTLPQQQLSQVNAALARGAVMVEALDADSRKVIDRGELQVVDNQIDAQTGTVKLKAVFPNETMQLWPGQFTNVRVRIDTQKDAITVPSAAVQRGPAGVFVYVVGAESKAEVRQIALGMMTESDVVATSGLEPGLRVVTSGFARLSEGARVVVMPAPEGARAPAGAQTLPSGADEGRKAGRGEGKGEGKGRRGKGGDASSSVEGKRGSEAAANTPGPMPGAQPREAVR